MRTLSLSHSFSSREFIKNRYAFHVKLCSNLYFLTLPEHRPRRCVKVNCATIAKLLFSQGGFALAPWPHATFPRATRAFLKYQREVRRVGTFSRADNNKCACTSRNLMITSTCFHVTRKYNISSRDRSICNYYHACLTHHYRHYWETGLCVCISNCRIIMLSTLLFAYFNAKIIETSLAFVWIFLSLFLNQTYSRDYDLLWTF